LLDEELPIAFFFYIVVHVVHVVVVVVVGGGRRSRGGDVVVVDTRVILCGFGLWGVLQLSMFARA
jgi:hypothetical protein